MTLKNNIFSLPPMLPRPDESELFEALVKDKEKGVLIERIVSTGQITPENEWYDQEKDEWVVLLQGKAKLLFDEIGGKEMSLEVGDAVFIQGRRRHRVVFTSSEPPCIWLAVHF